MASLARFSLGRVLLHLIAMLGDRALGFHCAGIYRELHWLTAATAILNRIGVRLVGALVRYLAQPIKHCEPSSPADLHSLSAVLQHGDVLLTEGNTRMAQLVKRITRSTWSHVAMYVGPLEDGRDPPCIVEADVAAGVRAVPLSEFTGQRVSVLRHTGLHDVDRHQVADWVVSRIGDGYDVPRAWALARRSLRPSGPAGRQSECNMMPQEARRFICTSLLAQAFALIGHPIVFDKAGDDCASSGDHRFITPPDFERSLAFEVVRAA